MARELTNLQNLPSVFADALKIDNHVTAGDISVTQLIDSPQIRILKKLHPEIQGDVSDMIFALMGTSLHSVMERAHNEDFLQEAYRKVLVDLNEVGTENKVYNELKELYDARYGQIESDFIYEKTLTIKVGDTAISGTFDLYQKSIKKLMDYKMTSVWSFVYPEAKLKWFAQLNVYAYMLKQHGYPVESASVIAIFRDWSKSKVIQNPDYPKTQVMEIDIPLYDDTKISEYIAGRVELHRQAELGNILECTGKERWAKSDSFAAKVPGGKKAMKVFDSKIGAEKWLEMNKNNFEGLFIETRKGSSLRCDEYCPVSQVCEQRKRMLNQK